MRIATFNVENLFSRVRAMNGESWEAGRAILNDYARLNRLICKDRYGARDRRDIAAALERLGLAKRDEGRFAVLRQNKGRLVQRHRDAPIEVVAGGRDEWIGWIELRKEAVDEVATRNTARVIRDVNADILAVVEAEDRIALRRFNEQVLPQVGAAPYAHIMLIDGNDERGIDVGLLTREGHAIAAMCSHVDDRDGSRFIFSRDCPEYLVRLPSGAEIRVLVNHLKSKGFGPQAQSNARRKEQARRVREIYDARRSAGEASVAVVGDLNDTPESEPLAPLLRNGSDLKDVSQHSNYAGDGRPGTYGNGTKSGKIDYILLSPALFERVRAAGVFRKGVWGGKSGTLWETYQEMTGPHQAASDHAALYADLDL